MWECNKCQHENEVSDESCWSCGNSKPKELPETPLKSHDSVCPNCNSPRIIPNVQILDRDGDYHDSSLSVRIDRNPNALMMKGSEVCSLRAWICGECGLAQIFASHPDALWKAYTVSQVGEKSLKGLVKGND